MKSRRIQELSRRLLANYLMFGLLSIVALAMGVMLIVGFSATPKAGQTLLARLATARDQIVDDFLDRDGKGVQAIVADLSESNDLLSCSVISSEGVFLAHSNSQLVGRKAPRNFSAATAPGVIERISYLREDDTGPQEYWMPLRQGGRTFGMLQAGVQSGNAETWVAAASRHAGTVALLPLVLLILGGFRLNGVVKSSSAIERQLSRLAADESDAPALQTVEVRGPASVGWNRLVASSSKRQLMDSLETRFGAALGSFHDEQYEHILQGLTDGIAATNEQGVITFANKAFAVLLNADPKDICGANVTDVAPNHMPPAVRDEFARQIREPSRPGLAEIQTGDDIADGVLRLARITLRSDDGKTVTQLWTLRDITQQKLVERTRDQFVDTATHELRTPLSTIKACAEILELEEGIDLDTQKQYLNTINMEATRLGRFIDEFLNISRIEAGSLAVCKYEADFDRLLTDVIDKVRPQMDQKQIEFQVLLPPKLPKLNIDKDKISAALVNLLGNAAKYTLADGRVTLQVELGEEEVRVHVEDTGIGISSEDLPKVFNRFFRGDDDRVREVTGTGLGLAFSQEVIRLHGGKIVVQSELDHGSRFTVSLPLS